MAMIFQGSGRLYYVLLKWGYYGADPWKIIAVWQGGMAIHGGLIGGLLGVWWFTRTSGIPFLTLCDMIVPALSLGHAFGRFGNFMNGDAHGYPLRSPQLPDWLRHFPDWLGVTFPPTSIAMPPCQTPAHVAAKVSASHLGESLDS